MRCRLLSLAALAIFAEGALATIAPAIDVSIIDPDILPVQGSQTISIQLTSPIAGTLSNLSFGSELEDPENPLSGYFVIQGHDFSGPVAMSAMTPVPVNVTLVPRDLHKPLEITFEFDGHRIERALYLVPSWSNGLIATGSLNKSGDPNAPSQRDESLAIPGMAPLTRTDVIDRSNDPEHAECTANKNLDIRVKGRIVYLRPDGIKVGADGVTVRAYDEDVVFDEFLAGQVTDAWGNFDFTFHYHNNLDPAPDLYLEVTAASNKSDIVWPNVLQESHTFVTGVFDNFAALLADYGELSPSEMGRHPALHMQTTLSRTWRELNARGYGSIPSVNVWWPDATKIPYYVDFFNHIHMNPQRQWWESSIVHEYGHHFNAEYGGSDWDDYCNPGGYADDSESCGHTAWCSEDAGVAWNEGIADFMSSYVLDEIEQDWGKVFNDRDRETLAGCGEAGGAIGNFTTTEGVLAAFAYDVADGGKEIDPNRFANGEDLLNFGMASVLNVVATYKPSTPIAFLNALRAEYPAYEQKIWSTLANNAYNFDGTPPSAPINFTSTSHATTGDSPDQTVDLVWGAASDPQSGIWDYELSVTSSLGTQTYQIDGTSFTTPELTVGYNYFFNLRARNNAGVYGASASFSPVTIRAASPPNPEVYTGFWSFPMVPRATTGSSLIYAPTPTILVGNQPFTWLNYHVSNDGELAVPATIRLQSYVDGVMNFNHPIANLAAYGQMAFVDIGPITVRGGRHTLSVFADATRLISEPDETDNYYHKQWVWSALGVPNATWIARAAPPSAWGGFDTVNYIFDSPNCDGLVFSLYSDYVSGVVIVPSFAAEDHDLRAYPVVSGVSGGFETLDRIADSFRPAGCLDAVFSNNLITPLESINVGVLDFDDTYKQGYQVRRIASTHVSSGSNVQVTIPAGQYMALRTVNLSGSGVTEGRGILSTDPANGPVHMAIFDGDDVHFGLDDAIYETVTDENGEAQLPFLYSATFHIVAIWQDPIDLPSSKQMADVSVVMNVGPKRADLLPYKKSAWYDAVALSYGAPGSASGVPIPSTLVGNTSTTYFSALVRNVSPTTAVPFDMLVHVDGVGLVGTQVGGLLSMGIAGGNYQTAFSIPGGRHTVSLQSDALDDVIEDDELNNNTGRQYVWTPYQMSATPLNRSAPPEALGGWGDLLHPGSLGYTLYPNSDGLRTPVYSVIGDFRTWQGVGVVPTGSSDVDLRLHEQAESIFDGFDETLEMSTWPAGSNEYVLVNFRATPERQFDVGVVNVSGSDSYRARATYSFFVGANPSGTYPKSSPYSYQMSMDDNLTLHEVYLDPGVVVIRLTPVPGSVGGAEVSNAIDWGMTIHRAKIPYHSKSSTFETQSSWLKPVGAIEYLTYEVPESGYYCIAVWRASDSYPEQGRFTLTFDWITDAPPAEILPTVTRLAGASPNPFNPRTAIQFDLAEAAEVQLEIYNLRGARVRVLESALLPAGRHERVWDGFDGAGRQVASGTYFVKMHAGSSVDTQKLVLVK